VRAPQRGGTSRPDDACRSGRAWTEGSSGGHRPAQPGRWRHPLRGVQPGKMPLNGLPRMRQQHPGHSHTLRNPAACPRMNAHVSRQLSGTAIIPAEDQCSVPERDGQATQRTNCYLAFKQRRTDCRRRPGRLPSACPSPAWPPTSARCRKDDSASRHIRTGPRLSSALSLDGRGSVDNMLFTSSLAAGHVMAYGNGFPRCRLGSIAAGRSAGC
jgi:hypothetical protein